MQAVGKIGVLMPEIADPLDYELLRGIRAQALKLGYDVMIYSGIYNSQTDTVHDEYSKGLENIYTLIGKSQLDGILFPVDNFRDPPLIQQIEQMLVQSHIPCLILGEECPPLQSIYPRQQESIRLLTKHLIEAHGCRRLYCITGFPDHHSSAERAAGFRQAMHEARLPVSESDIFYGHFWKEIPRKIGQQIADGTLEQPDGIVCTSDSMAIALIESLHEKGIRVPDDICVTGYDGSWNAWLFQPSVTTASGREQQYGEDAVLQLYEMMTGVSVGYSATQQPIRYGGSCGCQAQENNVETWILKQSLMTQLQHSTANKQFLTANLIDRLRGAESLEEWAKAVDHVGHILPSWHWLDICLCNDWCADADNPALFRQRGFSDKMLLVLSKRRGKNEASMCLFPTVQILPALAQPHEPQLILLNSLHGHGQIFGYLATAYDDVAEIQADALFIHWCDAAANGLYAVQQRINTAKMRAQIELLTVHDPETGLYNRRGLAERLPQILHEAKQLDSAAQILLLTYLETAQKTGYEPAQLFASALRHSAPEKAVCARIQDKLFTVMFPQTLADAEELTSRVAQRFEKLLGHSSVLVHSALTLDHITLSEAQQRISAAADALMQQVALSGSGFDYKELLARLRREIAAEPQHDWNIAEMARSVGISRGHLQRLYKQYFGISCMEDIIELRLNRAKELLTYTNLRIQEIAMQCGYNNESHFMRQFKDRLGMTAVQYRTQAKN